MPKCLATIPACCASSKSLELNPIENVFTLTSEWDCIKETIVLESIPPDKNAPKGTSDCICEETAFDKTDSSLLTASDGVSEHLVFLAFL